MAKRAARKDNKSIITGVCVALVAIIVVVAIVIIARNGANTLNDDYFKSDGTKYVLTYETDSIDIDSEEGEEYIPTKTHIVYTYSGDEITGMKSYAEFADAATAEKAYQQLKDSDEEEAKNAELKGKYIIFTNDKSEYEELTASQIKERIELMETLKNMDTDSDDYVDDVDSEESTDDEEE